MPEDHKSKIEELEKELYSKDYKPPRVGDILRASTPGDSPTWDTASEAGTFVQEMTDNKTPHHKLKKFVKASIAFFVFALLVAGFIWWRGANVISSENITIGVSVPPGVAGGAPFTTSFTISNGNKAAIENASLFLEYPSGFYDPVTKAPLLHLSRDLGSIGQGQAVTQNVDTILYGEENADREVSVTLEYQVAGSNAVVKKTTTYSTKILSSPVVLGIQTVKEASSGQAMSFTVDTSSNTQNSLGKLLLTVEYPPGFTFKSSSPAPTYGTNTWDLGSFSPQTDRKVTIQGVIEGQETEQKAFRVMVGTPGENDERVIGVVYNAATEVLAITKPFLGLSVMMNGTPSNEYVAQQNRSIRVDINWVNNSTGRVTDASVEVHLAGDALNRYSIYASNGGFYRSTDNTIIWQKTNAPELAAIEPGAKGSMSFSFSPVNLGVGLGTSLKNPQIKLDISAHANGISDTGVMKDIATFASRVVKFESTLALSSEAFYGSGPFTNSGPLPPKADNQTTYTITWTVKNSSNSVSNAVMKTILPIYVGWANNIDPSGEDLTYNANTSEVTWNVGRVPSGGSRQASFQISLTPSVSQINTTPQLTGDTTLTATDEFTGSTVGGQASPVTTYLSTDSTFGQNQGAVIQ